MIDDTLLIEWLQKNQYSLISDDNGHWACTMDGMQSVPTTDGVHDICTSFFIAANDWKGSIREAIWGRIREEE